MITMGCGDTCPVFPGKKYLDWALDDPAGQGVDAVRPIRDLVDILADGWTLNKVHTFEEGDLPRRLWRVTQSLPR